MHKHIVSIFFLSRMEGKEFVGSTFDTSDSEGVVIGCRRPFNIKQKKVKGPRGCSQIMNFYTAPSVIF